VAANSLYVLDAASRWPRGRLLASEPLDDDEAWSPVPDDHLVTLAGDSVSVRPAML
jgi:glutamine amidotransferase